MPRHGRCNLQSNVTFVGDLPSTANFLGAYCLNAMSEVKIVMVCPLTMRSPHNSRGRNCSIPADQNMFNTLLVINSTLLFCWGAQYVLLEGTGTCSNVIQVALIV